MSECKHPGCPRPTRTAGYCNAHYLRKQRGRDMDAPVEPRGLTQEQRFWLKVDKSGDCWIWQGSLLRGYGQFRYKGATRYAHRAAYEMFRGQIPEGKHLDHICWNRSCVRPDHLKVVTQAENNQNYPRARADSSTGIRGVFWDDEKKKYGARAQARGVGRFFKRFDTIEEAEAAVTEWRRHNMPHSIADQRPDTGSFFMPKNESDTK